MPRDSQQAKVYDAERRAFAPYPDDLGTDREAQAFVNEVTGSKYWKAMGGRVQVLFKANKRNNEHARGWHTIIEIPPWARSKVLVLHELSHSLVGYTISDYTHGQEYVLVYRRLIENHLGIEVRQAFDREAETLKLRWGIGRLSPQKIEAGI